MFLSEGVVRGAFGVNGLDGVGLKIYDGIELNESDLLFENTEGDQSRFERIERIHVVDRPWTLVFTSSSDYGRTQLTEALPIIVLFSGVLFSVFIAIVLFQFISSRQKIQLYAQEVTEDLQREKAKDEAMLNSLGEGLVATGKDGNIIFVNDSFERMVGWKENEVLGKKLQFVIPMHDYDNRPIAEQHRPIAQILRKKSSSVSFSGLKFVRKNGSNFPALVTASPIKLEGEVIGAVEVFRDITQEQLVDKAKTEFVSLASHQLRTPLSAINWYTEILLEGDSGALNDDQREYLEEIYHGSQRMVELINALLNVSRIEMGTFTVDPEPTDISALVDKVVKEQRKDIEEKNIEFSSDVDESIGEIMLDKKLIWMVLQNLLSNAIKYTPGGGMVSLQVQKIAHGSLFGGRALNQDMVCVTVSDTGFGIREDQQDKIFTKMFRADNVKERDVEGTGLGLYLVKSIIEVSGGSIWFHSKENQGTTFYFTLPIKGMKTKKGTRKLQ
jgi:PAS domain S-box-containing protein